MPSSVPLFILLLCAAACGSPDVLVEDPGATGVCSAGTVLCNGNTEKRCRADETGWDLDECSIGCVGGQGCLSSSCTPGSRDCVEPKLARFCDAAGQSQLTVCDHGCLNGECVDISCSAGLAFCEPDGNKRFRCSEDGLTVEEIETCAHGCNAADATCKDPVCNPGQVQCNISGNPEICNDDRTGFEDTGLVCSEKCVDGECFVSACTSGEERCGASGVQTCKTDGTGFVTTEQCDWGCLESNQGDALCALCPPNAYRCDGLEVQFCSAPFTPWQTVKTCDAIDTCVQGACVQVVSLVGDSTQDGVLLLLVEAIADCWLLMEDAKKGQDDEVCRGLNTQAMQGDLSKDEVANWFCNNQSDELLTADDFVTSDHFEAAKEVLGCGILDIDDLTIDTLNKKIHAGLAQAECIAYKKKDSEIIIAPCEDLP